MKSAAVVAMPLLAMVLRQVRRARRVAELARVLEEKFPKHWAALSVAVKADAHDGSKEWQRGDLQLQKKLLERYVRRRRLTTSPLVHVQLRALMTFCNGNPLCSDALHVRPSRIHGAGMGLFCGRSFNSGELLCVYSGTEMSLRDAMKCDDTSYVMGGFGLNVHINAKHHPNVLARYINDNFDRSKINCVFVKLKRERKALVVAARSLYCGEELYAEYGQGYWKSR